MDIALRLAARGLGRVWPNPAVGCVIVTPEGEIVGRAATAPSGRPHAETLALAQAAARARGATAYVCLEPCAHHGKTPPCAQALVEAGIARVVVACIDADPRVDGKGIAYLRGSHVEVIDGVRSDEALRLNEGFFLRLKEGRPHVTLKLAASRDGKLTTHTRTSQWLTGEQARCTVHMLRAESDAVMIGSATALVDDPELTVRLPGLEAHQPVRIVADGRLRLPLTSKLVQSCAQVPLWLLTRPDADRQRARAFRDLGVRVFEIEPDSEGLNMLDALAALGEAGLTRILVEGGARLGGSLLKHKLVDRLVWFSAPLIIGGDGYDAIAGLGLDEVAEAPRFRLQESRRLGDDMLAIYTRLE
jgi:diaminohydroxyphosphoribosylaminopyrimidine deaminase/5-amino-6-(5-phosphoribosylamino)uracil reductase